jgi:TonB-dependent receptor
MPQSAFCKLVVGIIVVSLPISSVVAADEVDLSGRIQSVDDHRPIEGVRVEIRELHKTATTGRDGQYRFRDLAPGSYTLVVTPRNGASTERPVALRQGDRDTTLNVDLAAASGAVTLAEMQVTARTTQAIAARAMQQDAPNLILVQPSTEIEKLPDINAGEAVRRLPGISLETDTGEGRFVNIRGIDADLNSTTFDGVRLPPTNTATPAGGGRAVAFDAIPAGLIGSITVTNTNLPEQDAEALGGTVDIKPKQLPRNKDYLLEAELAYGNENLRDTPVKDVQVTGGGRFGFGDSAYKPFSFIGTISYYEDKRGIDDIEDAYVDGQADGVPDKAFAEFDQRFYDYHRTRHAYGGEFAYEPNDANRWYVRYYDTGYTELKSDQHLDISLYNDPTLFGPDSSNPNGFIDRGATFDKKLVDHKEEINSRVAAIGGVNDFQHFKLDYHVALTIGSYNNFYNYNSDFRTPDDAFGTVQYDNTTDPNHPRVVFAGGLNPLDPTQYALHKISNDTAHDHEQERSAVVNATIPTSYFGGDGENIKVGVSARIRNRNNEIGSFGYDVPPLLLSNADTSRIVTYYGGRYQNGNNIDPNVIRYLIHTLPVSENTDDEAAGFARGEEDIYAGYAQYQFTPIDKLGILAGVRYERTDGTYHVIQQTLDENGDVASNTPVSYERNYDNFFPTVQLKYEFAPDLIARAVYSKTIARPGFNQVSASVSVDPGQGTISTGNPNLKPINSDNFDFDIEYYLPNGGIASAGLFHKELSDYIVRTQFTELNPTTGPLAGFSGIVHVTGWENIDSARATGAQLNYVQKFRDLPGLWSGLGVNANYTYVDSRLQIRPGDFSLLPSTSKHTANLAVSYDYDGFSANLAGYYTSKNIFAVGGSDATDIWSQPRFSLDFGATYAFNDFLTVFFDAKNLTNTALKFTEGPGANRLIQREYYNATLLAGIRLKL